MASNEALDLSYDPRLLMPGFKAYKNTNGYTSVLLHYSADPEGKPEEERRIGTVENDFLREHDLSFESYAGKPVYGAVYNSAVHEDPTIAFIKEIPIWRGWDFGYHRPGVVLSQVFPDGSWTLIGEILGENQTLNRFVEDSVLPYLHSRFPEANYIDVADPAGRQVSDKTEHTSFTILNQYGIFPRGKRSEITEGLTLIRNKLQAVVQRQPGLKINPDTTPLTTEGFRGGYRYPEPTLSTPDPVVPAKDGLYDHLMDCVRYIAIHAFSLWRPVVKEHREPTREERFLARKKKPSFDEFGLEI